MMFAPNLILMLQKKIIYVCVYIYLYTYIHIYIYEREREEGPTERQCTQMWQNINNFLI